MNYKNKKSYEDINLFIIFILVGFALRFWATQYGSNMDFAMWEFNLDLFKQGVSFYEFGNYSYSTPWIYTLYILDSISFPILENSSFVKNTPGEFYRIKIVFFLSIIDLLIFYLLYKNYSLKIGLFFFLNPIIIIITGHHNQFSQFAILFGFLSILLYENKNLKYKLLIPPLLLGLSLSIKHILIFFPIWWAFKEKKLINKILVVTIPYTFFILSFFPYLITDLEFIIHKLCCFGMRSDGPFWGMFGPKIIHMYFDLQTLYSLILIGLGIVLVDKKLLESFYFYLMALVIFSSMMYTQYLAIPVIAIAVYWNWKYLIYTLLTFAVFLVDGDQIKIEYLRQIFDWDLRATRISFYPIILILLICFLEEIFGKKNFYKFFVNIYKFILKKIYLSLKFKL
tara:strand:+ start:338 stop:1528 length:1191 start_codon:yes stop_codon:yes gene_type:complete